VDLSESPDTPPRVLRSLFLFHVHLPAPKQAVERAGAAMLAERGVQLYPRVRSLPDPWRCAFEISVGENAMEFTPGEVAGLIRELLARAA
jgi:hypothetical protein